MRNVHKAQPAGEDAFRDTAHMDEGIGGGKAHGTNGTAPGGEDDFHDALPPWLDGNDLLSVEAETPEILIGVEDEDEHGDHGILRQGSKLVIGGGSKMGKTWCLIDLALAVAGGGKWLGRYPCRQGTVLYVNLELKPHTAAKRLRRIAEKRGHAQKLGLKPEVSKAIKTWNLRGKCYDIITMLESARMRLRDKDAPKFVLIVLDPIYKTYGGKDENSAGDMGALMLELERFADECGAAIAFAAHFSKGNQSGKDAMDRISGSGVISRDPDAILTFTSHEEEDCYTLDAILREFAPLPPTVFCWEHPVMNPRTDLDPTKLKQPGKTKDTFTPKAEAIVEVLRTDGGGPMKSGELIIRAKAITKDNFSAAAWKQAINRHSHILTEMGVEKVSESTKEASFRLASKDPF
jgi:hypothetical protein